MTTPNERDKLGSWMQGQTQWTGPGAEFKYQPAPLMSRVIALCIDWAVASVISYAFFVSDPLWTLGIFALQYVILGWTLGGSFGHYIMRLQVMSINARRAILVQILIRTVLLLLVIPAVVWDGSGRGLHDVLARTVIIRRGSHQNN